MDYISTFSEKESALLEVYNKLTDQEMILPYLALYTEIQSVERQLPKKNIKHLDIGCGDGSFTKAFVDYLERSGYKLISTLVDSSPNMTYKARLLFDSKHVIDSTWNQFNPMSYDIVTAFHSWYGISGEDALKKFHDSIREGGIGYIVLSDANSCVLNIQRMKFPVISAQDVMNTLGNLDIKFRYKTVDSMVDLNDMLSDEGISDKAISVAEFLQHNSIDDKIRKKIRLSFDSYKDNTGYLILEKHGIITIGK